VGELVADGVIRGMQLIRRYKPQGNLATFPIATAPMIGLTLHRLSGLPLVLDFRDGMTEPGYPVNPTTWKIHRRLESRLIAACSRAIFTTRAARDMYAERYPDKPASCWTVIENGFDEDNFRDAEQGLDTRRLGPEGQMVLVHSGVLPRRTRSAGLLAALQAMKRAGEVSAASLRIILRATGTDDYYSKLLAEYGIDDIVTIEPVVAYRIALQEMMRADGLLLFQAAACNKQIPAKLYEYARAGKPIIALTDFAGNTAGTLNTLQAPWIADITDAGKIREMLGTIIARWRDGTCTGSSASSPTPARAARAPPSWPDCSTACPPEPH
jgi:glycosyltransferase involved in cell wall biosynthesis